MARTMVEISISTMHSGELRHASIEAEVPDGVPWEAAAQMASAVSAAYARLWDVPPETVHASATLAQTERTVLRHGDVRADDRAMRLKKP